MFSFQKETNEKAQNKGGVNVDKNKLLYFVKDRGFSVAGFCEAIDMSYSKFYGKCTAERFTISDIWKIMDVLKLSLEEIGSIFFAKYVS